MKPRITKRKAHGWDCWVCRTRDFHGYGETPEEAWQDWFDQMLEFEIKDAEGYQ